MAVWPEYMVILPLSPIMAGSWDDQVHGTVQTLELCRDDGSF